MDSNYNSEKGRWCLLLFACWRTNQNLLWRHWGIFIIFTCYMRLINFCNTKLQNWKESQGYVKIILLLAFSQLVIMYLPAQPIVFFLAIYLFNDVNVAWLGKWVSPCTKFHTRGVECLNKRINTGSSRNTSFRGCREMRLCRKNYALLRETRITHSGEKWICVSKWFFQMKYKFSSVKQMNSGNF